MVREEKRLAAFCMARYYSEAAEEPQLVRDYDEPVQEYMVGTEVDVYPRDPDGGEWRKGTVMELAPEGPGTVLVEYFAKREAVFPTDSKHLRPFVDPSSALPLVKEIFAMFDADGDGKLSKAEYEAYLRGIGAWGTGPYTNGGWDEHWPKECELMDSGTDGITREGFESILYGKYRAGQAHADLDACKQARAD